MNDEHGLNPYESPLTSESTPPIPTQADALLNASKGINRLVFFLVWMGSFISVGILDAILIASTGTDGGLPTTLFGIAVLGTAMGSRYRNAGYNSKWGWLVIVPIANLIGLIQCLYMPEAYAQTKQLDTTGRIILIVAGAVIVAFIVMMAIMFYTVASIH